MQNKFIANSWNIKIIQRVLIINCEGETNGMIGSKREMNGNKVCTCYICGHNYFLPFRYNLECKVVGCYVSWIYIPSLKTSDLRNNDWDGLCPPG